MPPVGSALPPLVPSAKRDTWRVQDEDASVADEDFRSVREGILERDRHACRYCGFRAEKWQEVHHVNDDHADNRPGNLITICALCHMVFHVGRAGAEREATLVYLPELPQVVVNWCVRGALLAQHAIKSGHADPRTCLGLAEAATDLLLLLRIREKEAAEHLGTCDPAVLGQALITVDGATYARRSEKLAPIRLLPLGRKVYGQQDRWPEIADYYLREGPYRGIPPATWVALHRNFRMRLGGGRGV